MSGLSRIHSTPPDLAVVPPVSAARSSTTTDAPRLAAATAAAPPATPLPTTTTSATRSHSSPQGASVTALPSRVLDPGRQQVGHAEVLRDALRSDELVDPGLHVPDAPLLVVDGLAAVGGELHRALDRREVLVVLVHDA